MSSSKLIPVVTRPRTSRSESAARNFPPDEHVSTGLHEILVHDMGQEEWPQVTLSDIGCLRLDWPKDLFAFAGRYQLELEQMRKACRDRFGPASSGTCPTCDKYIKVNLGKQVAHITSIWHSYGAAWSPGVRFGKGHHKTVWTTCARHTTHPSR